MKYRVLFLLIFCFGLVFATGEYVNVVGSKTLSFSITDDADTARIVTITPSHAVDSFFYHCSLSFQADTGSWDTVSWLSPVQTMIITATVDVATTYSCSVAFKEEPVTIGVEKDYASGVATVAALIDTLVDMINKKAGLTDSVTAEDSVTYIKLVSNFSTETFGERWTMIMVTAGGAGALDSAAHASQATVAIICDEMVAAINASDSEAYFTAYDSTTNYIVQSDKKGLTFHIAPTDTVQDDDSSTTQENVMSNSTDSGTVSLDMVRGFKHLDGIIILKPGPYSAMSVGNSDSAIVTLYSVGPDGRKIITVDTCPQVPCTCDVMIHSNVGDTALERQIEFHWWVDDTLSDTDLTVNIPAWWDLQLK